MGGEGVLAMILAAHGQAAEALPHAERALALAEKLLPPDHPDKVNALDTIGKIYLSLGRGPEAIAAHTRAEAICERLGDPPNETAETLHDLGDDYLRGGDAVKALAALERALQLREKLDGDKTELAETRMLMARALTTKGV
ncbi:MAG: tetratricopeptide repeat protein, partial [Polyangiaceae bacterium]